MSTLFNKLIKVGSVTLKPVKKDAKSMSVVELEKEVEKARENYNNKLGKKPTEAKRLELQPMKIKLKRLETILASKKEGEQQNQSQSANKKGGEKFENGDRIRIGKAKEAVFLTYTENGGAKVLLKDKRGNDYDEVMLVPPTIIGKLKKIK